MAETHRLHHHVYGKVVRSSSRYGAAAAILYTTGLRVSEMLGLSWDDIDLSAATAKVHQSFAASRSTISLDRETWPVEGLVAVSITIVARTSPKRSSLTRSSGRS
jgi:integrase